MAETNPSVTLTVSGDGNYVVSGGFCHRAADSTVLTEAKNRFGGKSAIVTGGAGNFGSTCAKRFASEGANIAIFDVRNAEKVVADIRQQYPNVKAESFIVDVTKYEQVEAVVSSVKADFGRIDYLFNNAGYQGEFAMTHEYPVDDFKRVIDINLIGVFNVLRAVSRAMIEQSPQGGVIVNTASMAAHSAPPNMVAYACSKSAVFHMSRITAKDLAPYNIRVNSVSPAFIGPGFMWTRQIELQALANSVYYDKNPQVVAEQMVGASPLKRYGGIPEVIGPVLFLFSDDASYLTGVDIQITGGMN